MSRTPNKKPKRPGTAALAAPPPAEFDDVLRLIDAARGRSVAAVNKELIDLYWSIGEHISRKIAADGWGQGTVTAGGREPSRPWPSTFGDASRTQGASPPET